MPAATPTYNPATMPIADAATDDENIPKAPPTGLRSRYIKLSWAYVRWCCGMFVWSMLCIVYFVLTRQTIEMYIAIGLGVVLLSMVLGPALLFGGETWYKRLGWMVVLLCMFSVMWVYPIIAVGLGIWRRITEGRYARWPQLTDTWHLVLCVFTVLLAVWTFVLTARLVRITRQLARGEFGEMDIRLREG
jgi:hypothetical protein